MHKTPEIFIRRWQEEFVDEETGEKVLIDREQLDYTFHNPELLPTLMKHVEAAPSDAEIEIYFRVDELVLQPKIVAENAESAFAPRLIIHVFNEDNRKDEVLDALKAQFPDLPWRFYRRDDIIEHDAIFNY